MARTQKTTAGLCPFGWCFISLNITINKLPNTLTRTLVYEYIDW